MQGVTVVDHPLVQHKLTLMRDKERSTKAFRQLLNEIGMLLCYEVTRDLPMQRDRDRDAADHDGKAPQIAGKKLVFAPILRAGVGFLDGMLEPRAGRASAISASTAIPKTLVAVEYYFKAPSDLADRMVLVLDPMLATANSAVAAIDRLKERGAKDLRFVCLLAAPEGIEKAPRRASGRADLDRRHRRAPQRPRLHRAGHSATPAPVSAGPAALGGGGGRYAATPHTEITASALHRRRLGNDPLPRLSVEGETILDQVSSNEGVSALQKASIATCSCANAALARGRARRAGAARRHGRKPRGLGRGALRPLPGRPGGDRPGHDRRWISGKAARAISCRACSASRRPAPST